MKKLALTKVSVSEFIEFYKINYRWDKKATIFFIVFVPLIFYYIGAIMKITNSDIFYLAVYSAFGIVLHKKREVYEVKKEVMLLPISNKKLINYYYIQTLLFFFVMFSFVEIGFVGRFDILRYLISISLIGIGCSIYFKENGVFINKRIEGLGVLILSVILYNMKMQLILLVLLLGIWYFFYRNLQKGIEVA